MLFCPWRVRALVKCMNFCFSDMSPFEVFFGRKSNREVNMLQVGQGTDEDDIEVEMERLPEGHTTEVGID